MTRVLGAMLILTVAAILVGCGGDGEDLVEEGQLRDCLAEAGLGPDPPQSRGAGATGYAPLSTAPDFVVYSAGGASVGVVVQKSEAKAERTAADVRAALGTFGVTDADERLIATRNVVAVFDDTPASEDRDAVSSCLETAG